jgi:hypothetical protein
MISDQSINVGCGCGRMAIWMDGEGLSIEKGMEWLGID